LRPGDRETRDDDERGRNVGLGSNSSTHVKENKG
jgi:hypothetical protein